jgi:hypothetical protein
VADHRGVRAVSSPRAWAFANLIGGNAMQLATLSPGDAFKVLMLLFSGVTQLDLAAPMDVFGRVRSVRTVSAAALTLPALQLLPSAPAVDARVVIDRNRITGGGVLTRG